MMTEPQRRKIFFVVFGLSGFSGLIYESIWSHYLKLFLGHAADAQTLVLAIFMGGMAIGAGLAARYSPRWKNLLVGYALVEGVVGICALFFHPTFEWMLDRAYFEVMPALGTPAAVLAFKWTLAALLILPQSILLGMTFPLMTGGIVRRDPSISGRSIASLYFVNSLGAAVGVLCSTFVFIPKAGLPGAMSCAGIINVALAVLVWSLARKLPAATTSPGAGGLPQRPVAPGYGLFLFAAFLTGAASFMYEIGWIRMLSMVLGSSTHAFELMLSAFILGLALGSLWIRRRIETIKGVVRYLGLVQIAMGLLALLTLPAYGQTFEVMHWVINTLNSSASGYSVFNLLSHFIALSIMLPATFCAGMTLPLLTFYLVNRGTGERAIGSVYAANTVGAIAGVFVAVHVVMPALGLKALIVIAATADMLLGLGLIAYTARRTRLSAFSPTFKWAMPACVIGVLATVLGIQLDPTRMASGVFRHGVDRIAGDSRVTFHQDGKTATVNLVEWSSGIVSLLTNGKPDATIRMREGGPPAPDEPAQVITAALPFVHHPNAKRAALIGFGSGKTSQTLLASPTLERLDAIEIEPAIVEAARKLRSFQPELGTAFDDPRTNIVIADAKSYFALHNQKYDVIVSQPSNPWVSGVAGLFSKEFYRRIGNYLEDDGVFVQWFQVYEINLPLIASVMKALGPHFEDYALYSIDDGDLAIVAGSSERVQQTSGDVFRVPELKRALEHVHVESQQDLELRLLGNKAVLEPFFASSPVSANSDYYPLLGHFAPQTRFQHLNAEDLLSLGRAPLPLIDMLSSSAGPRNEPTRATVLKQYKKSLLVANASRARDLLISDDDVDLDRIPENTRHALLLLKRILSDCSSGSAQDTLRGTFVHVAEVLVPFLTAGELTGFWHRVEDSACFVQLPAGQRDWYQLVKAVAERDADEMVRVSQKLLNGGTAELPRAERRFLIGAAMLASVALDRGNEARAIWDRYIGESPLDKKPPFYVRLLLAHAAADRHLRDTEIARQLMPQANADAG